MTPDEANILRYLEERPFASTHTVARHFRWGLPPPNYGCVAYWRTATLRRTRGAIIVSRSSGRMP